MWVRTDARDDFVGGRHGDGGHLGAHAGQRAEFLVGLGNVVVVLLAKLLACLSDVLGLAPPEAFQPDKRA